MKKTWTKESLSSKWEGEIELNDKIYYTQCDYDLDYTVDDGDDVTPPDTSIDNVDMHNVVIYAYNEDNGDFDIELTELNSPSLYESLLNKMEEEIVRYEYDWL